MPGEVSQVSSVASPVSTSEALGMLESAMGYLSAADATAMAERDQARCLVALERVTAMGTAARPRSWPRSPPGRGTARTRITARGPAPLAYGRVRGR